MQQTDSERGRCIDPFPCLKEPLRLALANRTDNVRRDRRWNQSEPHLGGGKPRGTRGDGDIARRNQAEPSTYRRALNARKGRLRGRGNHLEETCEPSRIRGVVLDGCAPLALHPLRIRTSGE